MSKASPYFIKPCKSEYISIDISTRHIYIVCMEHDRRIHVILSHNLEIPLLLLNLHFMLWKIMNSSLLSYGVFLWYIFAEKSFHFYPLLSSHSFKRWLSIYIRSPFTRLNSMMQQHFWFFCFVFWLFHPLLEIQLNFWIGL